MEDGVTEVQSFLPPQSVDSQDGSKREENDDEKEEGFVSEAEKSVEEDLGTEHSGKNCAAKDEAKDCDDGGVGGGGLINNLISTFITPSNLKTEEGGAAAVGDDADGGERGGVDNGGGEGGIISNLVSNFFHPSEGEQDVVESEKEKEEEEEILVDGKIKRQKTENFEDEANGGGGGGIIHNFVSHLPASLPDDAVPTPDEAIILINALVRD